MVSAAVLVAVSPPSSHGSPVPSVELERSSCMPCPGMRSRRIGMACWHRLPSSRRHNSPSMALHPDFSHTDGKSTLPHDTTTSSHLTWHEPATVDLWLLHLFLLLLSYPCAPRRPLSVLTMIATTKGEGLLEGLKIPDATWRTCSKQLEVSSRFRSKSFNSCWSCSRESTYAQCHVPWTLQTT